MAGVGESAVWHDPDPLVATRLEAVFAACFASRLQTRLEGGAGEPLYQPAQSPGQASVIYYRADYFASALHEIAHWCIAGTERRKLLDFGYWYAPDGRTAAQQHAFEAVECKPQAMEWLFARACGSRFKLSADNLDPNSGNIPDTSGFRRQVYRQAVLWQQALPQRAAEFYQGLCREFGTTTAVEKLSLSLTELA
jgi:elongation factor P hydroxylase